MSTPISSRADFQSLAQVRLDEAKRLLDAGMWDGAYYLAGYAVELALKACIIKWLMATDAFPERRFSDTCYSHNVTELLKLAGLEADWRAAAGADPDFSANWSVARSWSEQKRYHRIAEADARQLYAAITDPSHGVFAWISTRW